ncbi:hypothetical protein Poli38472_010879 [Pythium oligandrum]|uniref:Uncharacterized protein n=1 Tax=Pythium oligandrum TaxID=41045 RepID=A0A8K1FGM2_PYTOL|nr:hypothetical protein Poli38472_010879 [Pythium oligandrum]|eukprot:TMW61816.1 hypothetical protein Poli38472_010879 [Pythium oligandrum]
MKTYPDSGMVEVCFGQECKEYIPSLVFSLDRLGKDATVDPSTKQVTFGTVLADFDQTYRYDKDANGDLKPLLTAPVVDDEANPTGVKTTMTLLTCATGCVPRTASAADVQAAASASMPDAIALELDVLHRWSDTSVNPSGFEPITFPRGGLHLNLNMAISPPTNTLGFSLSGLALTFLVAAFGNGLPVTQITLAKPGGLMYLQRLSIGSELYVDLPEYAQVDGSYFPITVSAIVLTSGEKENLIQVTLEFGSSATSAVSYMSSLATIARPVTFPPSTSWYATALTTASGTTSPRNMVVQERGTFAYCLDATCSTSAVRMGFLGLGITDGVTLKRFPYSPALQLAYPQQQTLQTYANAEVYTSSFSVWTPQHPQSLIVKVDPSLASYHVSDPRLDVEVSYFLTAGSVTLGGIKLPIPINALKISLALEGWSFYYTSDRLMLNMSLASLTNNNADVVDLVANFSTIVHKTTVTIWDGHQALQVTLGEGKTLVLPLFAALDGLLQPIDVDVVPDHDTGLIVIMSFPIVVRTVSYYALLQELPLTPVTAKTLKHVDSWVVSGILLGLLAFIIFVVVLHCVKKTPPVKLDFSKVIP